MTVKEYGQIEGKLRSLYDPEKSDANDKLVMFIIRHLFCAITCNKLIISVTLVLNYMSNDEDERVTSIIANRQMACAGVFMTLKCESGP